MSLQKGSPPEFIPILGLDTNADPRNAPPGTLDIAQDCWFKRADVGGWELRKRFGYTPRSASLLQGGTVGSGRKFCSFNNEQLILSAAGLYSWDAQASKWNTMAAAPAAPLCTLTAEPVSATRLSALETCECAYGGGYICTVFGQGPNQPAHVTVLSVATGARVLDTNLAWSVTTGIQEIRVVALATVFMIVASFQTGNLLASKTIAFASPTTVGAEVSVSTTAARSGNAPFWDLQRAGSNDWALVGVQTTTPNTTVIRWNSNQTNGGSATSANVADGGMSWLTWDYSDGNGYLSYIGSAVGLKTFTVTATTAAISATTVNDAAVVTTSALSGYRTAGGQNNIFVTSAGGPTVNLFISRSTGGVVSVYQRGACVVGKPFLKGGRYFLPCTFDNFSTAAPTSGVQIDQRGYFILDVTSTAAFSAVVVSKAFYGEGSGIPGRSTSGVVAIQAATSFADIDANRTVIALRRRASDGYVVGGFPSDANVRDAWLVTMDFSQPAASPSATAGENLFLPGGAVKEYDGTTLGEAGFHLTPEYPAPTVAAGGYGAGTAGLVGAIIVWKYTDNRGQVRHSAPSQAQFVSTTAANGITTIACQTYRLSERATQVTIEVYLTAINGAVFYLVGQVVNDPTVDTVTFTTGATLAAGAGPTLAQQQAQLYTTDGTLAHEPLPPARLMAAWRGRLFLAGTEDGTDLWVSDEWFSGEGIYFSSANVISLEKEGGPITALAEMDDRLIIFKRSALYELVGGGPSASGDGNFDQPARITATVGTVIPESVVKTPMGLMFQSLRGYYLLPIGGGLPMRLRAPEALEGTAVTGAVVLEDREQVRFVCATGTVLVYHYGFQDQGGVGRWTAFALQPAVDCAILGGAFCYLTSAGLVNAENGAWNDNGAGYGMVIEWTHLNLAGMFGRCKLYDVLANLQVLSATTLTSLLAYNFDDAGANIPTESTPWTLATTSAVPIRLGPSQRRCTAVHVRLTEAASTGEGVRITGLGLEVGIESGGHRHGAAF